MLNTLRHAGTSRGLAEKEGKDSLEGGWFEEEEVGALRKRGKKNNS